MFDWNDYNIFSNSIISSSKLDTTLQEAYFRSAISRMYYAIYHKTCLYLISNGVNLKEVTDSKTSHENVIEKLSELGKYNASSFLGTLKDMRVTCDYRENLYINKNNFNIAKLAYKEVVNGLK